MEWTCAVAGCGRRFDDPKPLLKHQAKAHPSHTCKICEQTVPAGFFAIKHAFDHHRRSEYVRAYDADPNDIRLRERTLQAVIEAVDIDRIKALVEDDSRRVALEPADT